MPNELPAAPAVQRYMKSSEMTVAELFDTITGCSYWGTEFRHVVANDAEALKACRMLVAALSQSNILRGHDCIPQVRVVASAEQMRGVAARVIEKQDLTSRYMEVMDRLAKDSDVFDQTYFKLAEGRTTDMLCERDAEAMILRTLVDLQLL